jgi:hypothetical protein
MSNMEQLAYKLGMLCEVCLARMSGNCRSYSPRLTQGKRGCHIVTTPRNLSSAMVLRTTISKVGIRLIVNLCNDM